MLSLLLSAGAAGEDLVRVEVLVFTHQGGQSDRWPVSTLPDFSALIDPRSRAESAEWSARDLTTEEPGEEPESPDLEPAETIPEFGHPVTGPSLAPTDAIPGDLTAPGEEEPPGPAWPETFVHEDALSTTMQRAFDRLRASREHEVLSVTRWIQPLSRQAPATPVRVRDDTPVHIEWMQTLPSPVAFDQRLLGLTRPPVAQYRLDGSIRVRQRQFRHVDLDLVWSEPGASPPFGAPLEESAYKIHRLQQSRPIRLERLEYFDSAWLGVLILVEHWEPPDPPADG